MFSIHERRGRNWFERHPWKLHIPCPIGILDEHAEWRVSSFCFDVRALHLTRTSERAHIFQAVVQATVVFLVCPQVLFIPLKVAKDTFL